MNWIITRNNKPVNINSIPLVEIEKLRPDIIKKSGEGMRPVSFFSFKKSKEIILYIIMADDENSHLLISSSPMKGKSSYESITREVSSFWNFENEFHEETGIIPEGHPWLRGVRYPHNRHNPEKMIEDFPFFTMAGDEIHEVAVGPIHAGIIEPGHFRFMCQGETVHHLEIQLGYQHRGIESLFINNRLKYPVHLAESIAGDSVIAHSSAYVQAIESLCRTNISRRAQSIRAVALELERIAIHIGDLAAISNDVAYLLGNSVFGANRTLIVNTLLAICGSRYGRGLIRSGGVVFDISPGMSEEMAAALKKVKRVISDMCEKMFETPTVLSRLEFTGTVDTKTAGDMGMVGIAARASGLQRDVRSDFPSGIYRYFPVHKITMDSGDVFARTYLRYVEIKQSIDYILELLENMQNTKSLMTPLNKPARSSFTVSMTEGWRGEIVHTSITDASGNIARYKIKDPSFNNWFGLAQSVRGNGVSDFPLCNKSFDLSYAGHDL